MTIVQHEEQLPPEYGPDLYHPDHTPEWNPAPNPPGLNGAYHYRNVPTPQLRSALLPQDCDMPNSMLEAMALR